jgi:hypothetical protein
MSGKGSTRRPQEVPDEQVNDAWEKIFGQKKLGEKIPPSSPSEKCDRKDDVPEPKRS